MSRQAASRLACGWLGYQADGILSHEQQAKADALHGRHSPQQRKTCWPRCSRKLWLPASQHSLPHPATESTRRLNRRPAPERSALPAPAAGPTRQSVQILQRRLSRRGGQLHKGEAQARAAGGRLQGDVAHLAKAGNTKEGRRSKGWSETGGPF